MDRSLRTRLEARLGEYLRAPVYQRNDETEIRIDPGAVPDVLRLLHDPQAARSMGRQGQVRVREILDPAVNLDRIATMLDS